MKQLLTFTSIIITYKVEYNHLQFTYITMSQILLLKRGSDGRLLCLLHRRGKPIREAFHWGIPGGAFEGEERYVLSTQSNRDSAVSLKVCRRAALREGVEECAGGEHDLLAPRDRVSIGAIPECSMEGVMFKNVVLPPGLLGLVDESDCCRHMLVPFGRTKTRFTHVFIYILHPEVDADYFSQWRPRAMKPYRNEVDEAYNKAGCIHGYTW
jgi:hypothetical protein